jgi:preprotein translocase subunit SecG
MFAAFLVVHVLVSVLLVLVVLLQSGRGAELGAAFGSVGQATFGRGRPTFLSKFTTGLAVIFMTTSLSLAFMSNEKPSQSVLAPSASQEASGLQPVPQPEEAGRSPEGPPSAPEPQAPPSSEQSPPLQPTDAPPASKE